MKALKTVLIAGALLVAGSASAANFSNVEFNNGDVEIQGKAGSTVTAEFRIVVPAGEVVEMIQTDVTGDNLAPKCESVGGSKGLEEGTHYVKRSIKLPPNTGTYDLEVQGSGIFGGQRSIDCENDVVGNNTFSDALRVVGSQVNDDEEDVDLGSESFWDKISKMIAAAIAAANPPAPTKPAYCSTMPAYNGMNAAAVQGWLLGNPQFNGGFHAIGVYSPTGYWGSVSSSAYAAALSSCN